MPRRRTSTRRSNRRSTRRSTRRTTRSTRSTRRTNRSTRRTRNNRQRGGAGNPWENGLDNPHLLPDPEPDHKRQTLFEALENTRALPFAEPSAVVQPGTTLFDALNINPNNFKPKPPSQRNSLEKLMHGYDEFEGVLDRKYAPEVTSKMSRTLTPPLYEDVFGISERDIELSAQRGEIPHAPAPSDPVEQRAMEAKLEPLKKIFDVSQASAASEARKNPYSPFRSKAERDKILAEEKQMTKRAREAEPQISQEESNFNKFAGPRFAAGMDIDTIHREWDDKYDKMKREREQKLIALNKNRLSKSTNRRRGRGKGTALALKDQKIREEMLKQLEQSRMAQSSARSERSQRRSSMEGGMLELRPHMEIAGEYLNKQSSSSNSYQGINEGDYVNLPKEPFRQEADFRQVPLESFSSPREVEAPLGEPGQFQHRDDFVEMEELDQMVGKMYGRSKKARSKKAKGPSVGGPKKDIKKPTTAEARANRAHAMKKLKEKREKQASNTNKSSTTYKSRKDIADKRPRVKGRFASTGDNVITSKK